ncbi:hypothetical protein PHMEG_00036309 [Phytophthora megakarya]|uniref:Uncharacterized protein n=1 Tax=Phytophthora megakarya TaxID=4795 RepID=A0A225UMB0_9STRA|nr:hypothetical protein PHMEG_00036309 [Phytophthora megakarya]
MKCTADSSAVTVAETGTKWTILLKRSTKTSTPVRPRSSGGRPKTKSIDTELQA